MNKSELEASSGTSTSVVAYRRNNTKLICREMETRDINVALSIETESFEFPWPQSEFAQSVRGEERRGIVAEYDGFVVGYLIYEKRHNSYRLLSCAVSRLSRRQGVGACLLLALMKRLDVRHTRISCIVREKNVVAQLFLRSHGFSAIRVLKEFYTSTQEDAYRMNYRSDDWSLASDQIRQRLLLR